MQAYLRTTPAFFLRPVTILRSYSRELLQADIVAGLTVSIVLLPQGLAFALLAGLPPQMGLYSAIVAAIVGGLFGSSNHLHTGPTNTASALVLSTLLPIYAAGTPEYIAAAGVLAVFAGLLRLLLGLARLGLLVNFVSDAVAVGFTAGAGLLIMLGQLAPILRVSGGGRDVAEILGTLLPNLTASHFPSLLIGLGAILLILVLQRLAPKYSPVLSSIAILGLLVWLLGLEGQGVQVLGALEAQLPPLANLPLFDLDLIGQLSTGALAIAAIGLVEASAIARALASNSGQRLDSNQEFVGQGLANIATGFFSGYPCSGSFNRSAMAFSAGGRTSMTAVFSGLFVAAAVFVIGPLAAHLPRAALAGALLLTAYGMIDRRAIRRIWRGSRGDAVIMAVTLVSTLLLPLQFAVLIGVLMSLAYYILQTSSPRVVAVLPDDKFRHWGPQPAKPECPQLAVLDVLGDLYFGAVNHIEEQIFSHMQRYPGQRYLLLRMHSVLRCDISGIRALEAITRACRARGGDLFMVRVREPVLALMRATSFYEYLGPSRFLEEDRAIEHMFYKEIDPAVCIYECEVRAFRECQNLPKRPLPVATALRAGPLLGAPPAEVAPRELWQELHSSAPPLVVDVREPREFQQGHVPQARLMPLSTLLPTPALPHDQPLVVVCRSGRRSARAAVLLRNAGYEEVRVLRGGMLAWEAADLLEALGAG